MTNLVSNQFVRDTIALVRDMETAFFELGERLYKIREEKLYEDSYETFQEFLDDAHINKSMASKLAKIHEVYILNGGKEPQTLVGVGYSNLYEAIPIAQTEGIDNAVVKADKLTRAEIIEEVKESKYGEHVHVPGPERFAICQICGKFFRVDI
jgi:hypothetical protein